jgi:hypothetical protein
MSWEIIMNEEQSNLEYQVWRVSRYCFGINNDTEENYVNPEAVNRKTSSLATCRIQVK